MTTTVTFHVGDVRDTLTAIPDGSVNLVVTSPPFLALRSYLPADHPDKHREIGSEATPAAFLDTLLELTAEWRRVLHPSGSIAVEIGDTYSGSGGAGGDYNADGLREGQQKFSGSAAKRRTNGVGDEYRPPRTVHDVGWPLAKSLCGIPTLYTWSLAYGRNLLTGQPSPAGQWRIRNLLAWTRPNPPVGALGDKFRPATSYVTVGCLSDKRWFDLDAVRHEHVGGPHAVGTAMVNGEPRSTNGGFSNPAGAPPLDWHDDWQPLHRLPTQPYSGSHYATYPLALPRKLIEAMCPREVCAVCGEGRRRIVGDAEYIHTDGRGKVASLPAWPWGGDAVEKSRQGTHDPGNMTRTAPTLGWSDCGCGADLPTVYHDSHYHPGVVLDPFGGSGTTAVAAALTGRDAILCDLDERNIDLTRRRLAENVRIRDETRDGDTIVWTVEPATETQIAAQAAGQGELFDEGVAS